MGKYRKFRLDSWESKATAKAVAFLLPAAGFHVHICGWMLDRWTERVTIKKPFPCSGKAVVSFVVKGGSCLFPGMENFSALSERILSGWSYSK